MKKRTCLAIIFMCLCVFRFAQAKELQFRLVLNDEEAKKAAFDRYTDENGKDILVDRAVILSNKDIEQIGINKDEYGRALAVVGFTDSGKKRYLEFAKKNINRRLARIIDGKFWAAPHISEAQAGAPAAISVTSPAAAEELIKSLGFAPYLQRGIDSNDAAKISYDYARYAMVNGQEKIARRISLQLYKYNPNSEFYKKLIKDHPLLNISDATENKTKEDYCSGHRGVCGDKCCDGTSFLAAGEELYKDATYFTGPEPPKKDVTLPRPERLFYSGSEKRSSLIYGKKSPKRVITGPKESGRYSPWPVSLPRKKAKPMSQTPGQ